MKPTILTTLIFLVFTVFCNAQTIQYDYDNAGNRIARRVINITKAPKVVIPEEEEEEAAEEPEEEADNVLAFTEKIGEIQAHIFPNPTKGILKIEISDADKAEEITLTLYSGQGATLVEQKIQQGNNTLDLSTYSTGWYILRLQTGDYRKEYKIVKN